MSLRFLLRLILAVLASGCFASLAWAQVTGVFDVGQAQLTGLQGERTVNLPHQLERGDAAPQGATVRYRLSVNLNAPALEPLGVYVEKFGLSGRLSVNGRDFLSCDTGPLDQLRCLNRPQFFLVPADYWQVGRNELEFEIYANNRQANGLSRVWVGNAQTLEFEHYRPAEFWRVTLIEVLAWVSCLLGVLALWVAVALRQITPFFWFALSSLASAFVKSTILATHAWISADIFSGLAFGSRIFAGALLVLAALAFFERTRLNAVLQRLLLAYALIMPPMVWWVDFDRSLIAALYIPLLLVGLVAVVASVRWALGSRRPVHLIVAAMQLMLLALGLLDAVRFQDRSAFVGVYWVPYGQTVFSAVLAVVLARMLTDTLVRMRQSQEALESRVQDGRQQLRRANERISAMERTLLQLTENIPVGTYVLETDAQQQPRFTFLSDRWLQMLDLRREEVMADPGKGFSCVHPDDFEAFMALNRKVFAQIETFYWEGRIVVRGQVRWLRVESVPRRLSHGGAAWEGVMIDITEQKQAEQALMQAQAQLIAVEAERSRSEERENLLQDMHDGFGSQLASASILAERGGLSADAVAMLLQECMADLNLVIDTLGKSSDSLADALADFRFRTEQRLRAAGLTLHWKIDLDQAPAVAPRVTLHLLRIMQEGLSNVLRHAQARNIWIAAEFDRQTPALRLSVTDDGCGLPPSPQEGRGLSGMRNRAREIGARLSIGPREAGGTGLELIWAWRSATFDRTGVEKD